MSESVFVKPLKDLIVRDPKTKAPVPKEGMTVVLDGSMIGVYWRRQINDGSLIVVQEGVKAFDGTPSNKKGGGK